MLSDWQGQEGSVAQVQKKKKLETRMDSCMPSTGASGPFWMGEAQSSHRIAQLLPSKTPPLPPWSIYKQMYGKRKLTCFQKQLWASLRGHLWWNPEEKSRGSECYSETDGDEGRRCESLILHVHNPRRPTREPCWTSTAAEKEHRRLFWKQTQFPGREFSDTHTHTLFV